jgi:uncharacterized membrane protein
MVLESDKTIGGIGAILIALGMIIPFLGLVGIIMVLIAMKGFADYYADDSIFRDALYAIIFGIVGIVVLGIFVILFFFATSITSVTTSMMPPVSAPFFALSAIGFIILALAIVLVFFLLEAIFFRRAFDKLANKSGEGIFRTAGLLLLIGAVLTIVLVGLVLIFIAWIMAAVGYFSIKAKAMPSTAPPSIPPAASPPQPSVSFEKKYCPNCGAENTADAGYCVRCGKKL